MRSQYVAILSISLMLLTTAAQAQQTDPCAGVSCAGHGRCIVVRGEPACACEPGYTPDAIGLNCLAAGPPLPPPAVVDPPPPAVVAPPPPPQREVSPAPQPQPTPPPAGYPAPPPQAGDPCSGVTCSGFGTCGVVNGLATCGCQAGYVADQSGLQCQPESAVQQAVRERTRVVQRGAPGFSLYVAGLTLELSGVVMSTVGIVLYATDETAGTDEYGYYYEGDYYAASIALAVIGATAALTAIPLVVVGYLRMRRDFRAQHPSAGSARSLAIAPTLGPTPNGGLAFGLGGAF